MPFALVMAEKNLKLFQIRQSGNSVIVPAKICKQITYDARVNVIDLLADTVKPWGNLDIQQPSPSSV